MARPIAADYDEKRQAILRMAAEVFAKEGVARASMTQVAEAAGISKATIYHYYPSKDAMVFAILDTYLSDLRDRVLAVTIDTAVPESGLYKLLSEILLAYEGMDNEHQIQTEGLGLLPPDQQEVLKGHQRDMVRHLSNALRNIAPEVFADQTKLRSTTMSIFGMLNWFYMWNHNVDEAARQAYAELVADMVLGGVHAL